MAIKKQWFDVVAPKLFGEKVIAETVAFDPKNLVGRTVNVSLTELTDDYSKFYVKIKLQIERIEGNRAFTKFMGHYVTTERIYRMVQRRFRRIDCVQDVVTKDEKKMRIKTVFVLMNRVNTSIKDHARKHARELLDRVAKQNTLENLIKMIIKGDLQALVKQECSKIYPVGGIEIRKTELYE